MAYSEAVKDYKTYFKGKKVTLMRLGLLGRGVGDAAFLAECGADVLVVDDAAQEAMQPSVNKLKKYKTISYHFGPYQLADFRNRDFIVKGAGARLDSPEIAEARKNNIPVEMDASLLVKLARQFASGVTFIGVTGTRGKSTVTHLLFEILKKAGRSVYIGGNIRGQATLPLIKKLKADDIVVLELDSWQLQGFDSLETKLDIAVFTNFMNDHQNYYASAKLSASQSMDAYFADKANIYRFQTADNFLITNQATKNLITKKPFPTKAKKVIAKANDIPANWKLKLLGEHNRQNAAYAVAVARVLGVSDGIIKKTVESFAGLPGRLEFVREVGGVKFYNDTNGTTPEAVLAALAALKEYHNKIILIGGGSDKNLDYSQYLKVVPKAVKSLILFKGAATEKIIAGLSSNKSAQKLTVFVVESMGAALSLAKGAMAKGDVVLLSPGATSFGIFKNEYDRGDQFVKAVKKIK